MDLFNERKNKRPYIVMAILMGLIIVAFVISLNLGVIRMAPTDVLRTLLGFGSDRENLVLFDFRLPRIVIALIAGAGLAVAGAILQGVTQNELAEPGILGINAGAGLAVVLYIFFFQESLAGLGMISIFLMPFSALLGAGLAAFLIYILAWKNGASPIRLILVGIGVNAGFGALLLLFQLKMDPRDFMKATVWLTGNIAGSNWKYVVASLPWILILLPIAIYKARFLNILNLGDHLATGLGAETEKSRRILLAIAVALAGACVAVGGGIAFLGLVAPHLARRIVGPRNEILLPTAALMGALILLVADTIGRNIMSPLELPVGIVVSILGAPYFIYLLMKTN